MWIQFISKYFYKYIFNSIYLVEETMDLNCKTFNEYTEYYILPRFGPQDFFLNPNILEIVNSRMSKPYRIERGMT